MARKRTVAVAAAALAGSGLAGASPPVATATPLPPMPTPAPGTYDPATYCPLGHDLDADSMIYEREHVSCDDARAILRHLRGSRVLIPMACQRDRHLGGWRLHNVGLEWDLIASVFIRGDVRISYQRSGRGSIQCDRVPPFQSEGPS